MYIPIVMYTILCEVTDSNFFWNNWSIYLCSHLDVKLKFNDYLSTMFKHISIVSSMVMADTYISWSKLGCYPFSWNCG